MSREDVDTAESGHLAQEQVGCLLQQPFACSVGGTGTASCALEVVQPEAIAGCQQIQGEICIMCSQMWI